MSWFGGNRFLNDCCLRSLFLNYRCSDNFFLDDCLDLFCSDLGILMFLMNHLLMLLVDDWLVHLMDDLLMSLVDHWLMDLADLLLVDYRLVMLMDYILMMFMHNVFMMLMNNILMMLMDYISMGLSNNWCRHVALNASSLSMRLNDCTLGMTLDESSFIMDDCLGHFLIGGNDTNRLSLNLLDDRSSLDLLFDDCSTCTFFPNYSCCL